MADELSFTDSDDERAVEDVLSQALDNSVLEQIAAINCSSFSSKDNLPSHLETRFRKLKSLPTVTTTADSRPPPSKSKSFTPRSAEDLSLNDPEQLPCDKKGPQLQALSSESSPSSYDPEQHSDEEKKDSNWKLKSSSNSKTKSLKSKSKSWKSESDTWSVSSRETESRSVSPAGRGVGCLWCSPKKDKRKQGKENRSSLGDEYDVEFLKTFSVKEQKRIMRKAMKEEEKINREAEKIVKWAKQASSRMMDVSGVVDSDIEK